MRSDAGWAEAMHEERASLGIGIEAQQAVAGIRAAQENQDQGRIRGACRRHRSAGGVRRKTCPRG